VNEAVFKEKFIAFIDILGFKNHVEAAEKGDGLSLAELYDATDELGRLKTLAQIREYGPSICPESAHVAPDLDFQITQVSDCAIVSAEISPAGAINLVNHCWGAVLMLMTKGFMCRGFISRGLIHHTESRLAGSGYQNAYEKEQSTTAFAHEADERGTPFVEIDDEVSQYIEQHGDVCVKRMFSRYVKSDGSVTAIFPFQRLGHQFVIGGQIGPYRQQFDPEKEKRSNDICRQSITSFKDQMMKYVDPANIGAMQKVRHYITALDAQLEACDRTDELIDALCRPIGRPVSDLFSTE